MLARSGGGAIVIGGCRSQPLDNRCTSKPTGPNRPTKSEGFIATRSPRQLKPSRFNNDTTSRSISAKSASTDTGNCAKHRALSPGSTTTYRSAEACAVCAATSAVNRPSAMPTPNAIGRPSAKSASASWVIPCKRCANISSPPTYLDGPRVANKITPGVLTSTSGTSSLTARTTDSNINLSRSGLLVAICSSGHTDCASRRRMPICTP